MTNREILQVAMEQSARDLGCGAADFLAGENKVFPWRLGPEAKKYYKEPTSGILLSYGSGIVAAVHGELCAAVEEYLCGREWYHAFGTPDLYRLNERLAVAGQEAAFLAEYYLPRVEKMSPQPCAYELRVLHPADFAELYRPEWSNALCAERRELDVLGVGAYDGGRLVGLAGCSADAPQMWQIGVDVLPAYRRQGIAAALTSRLAQEILHRGKVPFYCTAWANVPSARNAVACGFLPAWVEMSLRPQNRA